MPEPCAFPLAVLLDSNEDAHGRPYAFRGLRADAKDGGGPLVVGTRVANLAWGDYSLDGYAGRFAVERKTLPDLFRTLTEGRERFEREMEALAGYDFACVAVEAGEADIFRVPPTAANPRSIHRTVLAYRARYRTVQWAFLANREFCERVTFRMLERALLESLPAKERRKPYSRMRLG